MSPKHRQFPREAAFAALASCAAIVVFAVTVLGHPLAEIAATLVVLPLRLFGIL